MRRIIISTVIFLITISFYGFRTVSGATDKVTQGRLEIIGADGEKMGMVPLKHTKVDAEISGFLSRVTVRQQFENNFTKKIEAVYVFPLPDKAAVDGMVMRIGERTIRGKVMKREKAREVYEAAKSNGQIASLLDQQRPNIFTQSVANILPGEKIEIEISYVETLKYQDGAYEFVFPMVVGPRYVPGGATGSSGPGFAPDTDQVPDGSLITPHVAKERAGHDISLNVRLYAGVPISSLRSRSHSIRSNMLSAGSYAVSLKKETTIPNKDFVLRYEVAGQTVEDAVLTHRGSNGGYFTMILQPPAKVNAREATPKEIVFVLDTSGSMSGFPIQKAKEAMKLALDGLNPYDTFNLITFAGDTRVLFKKPVAASPENLAKAQEFLKSRRGGGGTEMMKAIRTALAPSASQKHIRIVCFMTDGYIGNDFAIIGEVKKYPNARVFSFGIGSSVNRYLLTKMAEEGRGEVEFVSLKDDGSKAAKRFHERVRSPILTDITVDFGNLKVADVYPKRINDLFSAKPVIIHGRYLGSGKGTILLKGRSFGREVVRRIPVVFPKRQNSHDVLATLWARTRIADLMSRDYRGIQRGNTKPEIKETITNLGIEYRLMTQFTSFVAVEERVVTDGGKPMRIEVPVEMPEGVSREGVFGQSEAGRYGNKRKVYKSSGYPSRSMVKPNSPRPYTAGTPSVLLSKDDAEEGKKTTSVRTVRLPLPLYPAPKLKGAVTVTVDLEMDASGSVTRAKAVRRSDHFAKASEAAALRARFSIPGLGGTIGKVKGRITYLFSPEGKTSVKRGLFAVRIESKPNKLHSKIRELLRQFDSGGVSAVSRIGFVNNGRADIIVRVRKPDPRVKRLLAAKGMKVLANVVSARAFIGSVPVGRIRDIAALDAVTFISPRH